MSSQIDNSQMQQHFQLLARIDERTANMQTAIRELKGHAVTVDTRLTSIESEMSEIKPIKSIVYKGLGVVLLAVLAAVLGLVLTARKDPPAPVAVPEPVKQTVQSQ